MVLSPQPSLCPLPARSLLAPSAACFSFLSLLINRAWWCEERESERGTPPLPDVNSLLWSAPLRTCIVAHCPESCTLD